METVFYRASENGAVLGEPNIMAAIGNPLKGLMGGARWARPPWPSSIPSSLEWYTLGLDEMMTGDDTFDWTTLDDLLKDCASRHAHAVVSVYIHWPGQPLRLPPHLKDIELFETTSNGLSPNYGDPRILRALEQYIQALGIRYDSDQRILALHVGLLGFWGEGHTYPDVHLVPPEASSHVAAFYRQAFTHTQIQARYPGQNAKEMGLYDGSLFYNSLDGAANGGVDVSWFMEPQIQAAGQQDTWQSSIIGGETRPELQALLFTDLYPAGTENHQPFDATVDTLHVSYILHHDWVCNGGYTGTVLERARRAHAYIGYSFYVADVVAVTTSTPGNVDIVVTVAQVGIAPFYYDLALVLKSDALPESQQLDEIQTCLVQPGQSHTFRFAGLDANQVCECVVSLHLESSHVYPERPILWAQCNGNVSLTLPRPRSLETASRAI